MGENAGPVHAAGQMLDVLDGYAAEPNSTAERAREMQDTGDVDVVIIGGGIAGLTVALSLPLSMRVALASKSALGESNTRYAQGGLAAAVGSDDSPELHLRDTLAAGSGLVFEEAARVLVNEARDAVAWLIAAGARFDERSQAEHTARPRSDAPGAVGDELATRYQLGREAAHSRWRVLHAHGDATGAEIERALVASVRARPNTLVLEQTQAVSLVMDDGMCRGVRIMCEGIQTDVVARQGVVLANGGAGRLWLRTSNPVGATADGLALAHRAGAVLADLEFVQFHPTVLVPPSGNGEPFLISEAVRGEGAYLRNAAGERFMPRYHAGAELAPRDVVARAILSEMLAEDAPSAYLDLRHLPSAEMRRRFPSITEACRRYGLDLARDLIPVAPAAHYFMGGVVTDTWARTTVPHLFAVGEVACTGVHGANRLASNSLLEGLVYGRRLARVLSQEATGGTSIAEWSRAPRLPGYQVPVPERVLLPRGDGRMPIDEQARATLRRVMWEHVSLRRDTNGLREALNKLSELARQGPFDPETANMLFAAQAIAMAALRREESRGGHFREDYPLADPALDGQHSLFAAGGAVGMRTVTSGTLREGMVSHV